MTTEEPFAARPDPVLGRLLRDHLDPGGHDAFVARVLARRWQAAPVAVLELLGRWARIGIAVAGLIGAVAALGYRSADVGDGELLSVGEAIAAPDVPDGFFSGQLPLVPDPAQDTWQEES